MQPDDQGRFRLALLQCLRDHLKVGKHGLRRLVTVARILAQQSLDDFIQYARHGQTQAAQSGGCIVMCWRKTSPTLFP